MLPRIIPVEPIFEAAEEFAQKYYPAERYEEQHNVFKEGFVSCPIWAQEEFVKTLWHDASEKPAGYNLYICLKFKNGNFWEIMQVRDIMDWKDFAKKTPPFNWCYLNDILPKEGGEK